MFTLDPKQNETGKEVKKPVRQTTEETNHLVNSVGQYVSSMDKRDGYISAPLDSLVLSQRNGRMGQGELVAALPEIVAAIQAFLTSHDQKEPFIPSYEQIQVMDGCPVLSKSASHLLANCIDLANTFLSNNGFADTPPKVYPAVNGLHEMKTGHRRVIAYRLLKAIRPVSNIDVILDKGSETEANLLAQDIARLTENASRVDNTLAEHIFSFKLIYDLTIEKTGKEPNNAKFARDTGIERTRVGRIFEMVRNGAADDDKILTKIHESQVEDVTALHLLFLRPKSEWSQLLDELIEFGPTRFREKYPATQAAESESDPSGSDPQNAGGNTSNKGGSKKEPRAKNGFKITKQHEKSIDQIIIHLAESKNEWLEGIDSSLSPIEKLMAILGKISNDRVD